LIATKNISFSLKNKQFLKLKHSSQTIVWRIDSVARRV